MHTQPTQLTKPAPKPDTSEKKPKENLRQRAYLNTVASWIDTITKILVEFFVKPIIISMLGATFFGVWQIINQMNSYMATVDLRAGTSVKWYVARNRTVLDELELKKMMSAAFYANILFLPFYLLAGAVLVWLAPFVTKVDVEYYTLVRIATGLLVMSFIINQYAFLLQSVLVGMNLSFKKIGVRAALTIFGGIATVTVLYLGYNLPAMAVVQVVITILTGIILLWILKINVNWFGFIKAGWDRIINMLKLTGKFMALKIVDIINESSDLILLGYFAGPKYVAAYVISRYSVQVTSKIIRNVLSAVTPGLGKLVGEGNFSKLIEARSLIIKFNWLLITITGGIVLIWNRSFVALWTSAELYVGSVEALLIVIIASLKILKGIDRSIILMTLDIRNKILITALSAGIVIILSLLLIPIYQTLGLLIALFLGTLKLTVIFNIIAQNKVKGSSFISDMFLSRVSIVGVLLLFICYNIGGIIEVSTWFSLVYSLLISAFVLSGILWIFALSRRDKTIIIDNISKLRLLRLM